MSVHPVKVFISLLRSIEGLSDFDKHFLSCFEEKFKGVDDIVILNESQLQWVQQMFADRWSQIVCDPKSKNYTSLLDHDYTLNQKGVNLLWIRLAQKLEKELGKTYLEILMPTLKNKVDPNSFMKAEVSDLADVYMGDDDKTWYSVRGLLKRIEMKQKFSTYNTHKYSPPRAISLQELLRIRFKGQHHESFWNYLKNKIIPLWHEKGAVPQHMLPALLEILEIYFNEKIFEEKWPTIVKKLITWSKSLCECPIDDVNFLFGQTIQVGVNKFFLVDILLDLFHGEAPNLTNKLIGVIKWLFNYDGSYVLYRDKLKALQVSAINGSMSIDEVNQSSRGLYSSELASLYEVLNAGPWFGLDQILQHLKQIQVDSSEGIKGKISRLLSQKQDKPRIDYKLIGVMAGLFDWRWREIKGTVSDYTCDQGDINAKWIRLAQLMVGAGYIKPNYYRFLMPSINYDNDPVQLESLTCYPLSHYLLSQDEHELILIPNCINHLKVSGYFCNCNTTPPMPLTKIELSRLQFAENRYRKYFTIASTTKLDEEPISIETIKAIYSLVEQSLFAIGLQFGHDYDDEQISSADKAYYIFYNFLHQLSKEERERLNAQRILFNNKYLSFGQIMAKIEKGECIAFYGQYLVQLVIDYDPDICFKKEIETNLPLKKMRASSRRKVYFDYQSIDREEALRRLNVLALSVMTYDFENHNMTEEVNVWNIKNRVSSVPKSILQVLISFMESNEGSDPRFVYAKILETIVKPAIREKKQHSVTFSWLISILNNTLFTKKLVWFDPIQLLRIISTPDFSLPPDLHFLFEQFYDECIQVYSQNQTNLIHDLLINYKFSKLMTTIDRKTHEYVLSFISTKDSKAVFPMLLGNHLIHRLAIIGSQTKQMRELHTFFESTNYYRIRELLKKDLDSHEPLSLQQIMSILTATIKSMDISDCNENSKLSMIKFLGKLNPPKLTQSVDCDSEQIVQNYGMLK